MTTPNQWPITGTLRAGWVFSYEPQTMDHLAHQGFCCANAHNLNTRIHNGMRNRTTDTMNTTLAQLRELKPCASGWRKLLLHLDPLWPEDRPIPLTSLLESNGWRDAVWALRATHGIDKQIRLFACDCAERSLPKFESRYPDDNRLRQAIKVARRYAEGLATAEELLVARKAASAAAATAASDADAAATAAATAAYAASASANADANAYAAAYGAYAASAHATSTAAAIVSLFRKYFEPATA